MQYVRPEFEAILLSKIRGQISTDPNMKNLSESDWKFFVKYKNRAPKIA